MGRTAHGAAAFTLIELLTVIVIILLVAGLVIGISSYASRQAVEARIRSEIKIMEAALEAYKADYGGYPPLDSDALDNLATSTNGGLTNRFLSTISVPASYDRPNTNGWLNIHYVWRALSGTNTPKTYMNFSSRQLVQVTNVGLPFVYTLILDPNGNPYGYNPQTPTGNPQTFDLWSAGVDARSSYPNMSNTNDDIGNWHR